METKAPIDEPCLTCGHGKRSHIYEEGACRPGFTCAALCEKFESQPKAVDESELFAHENHIDKCILYTEGLNEFNRTNSIAKMLASEVIRLRVAMQKTPEPASTESSKPKDAKPRIFLKASDIYHAWRELEKNTAGYYCFNEYEIERAK